MHLNFRSIQNRAILNCRMNVPAAMVVHNRKMNSKVYLLQQSSSKRFRNEPSFSQLEESSTTHVAACRNMYLRQGGKLAFTWSRKKQENHSLAKCWDMQCELCYYQCSKMLMSGWWEVFRAPSRLGYQCLLNNVDWSMSFFSHHVNCLIGQLNPHVAITKQIGW